MLDKFLLFLLIIPSTFAYIDPGTGGYLLSSIWSWLVAMFALILGIIVRFFKHTLRNWFTKHPFIFITIISLILSTSLYVLTIYLEDKPNYTLPAYDESLNGAHILSNNYYDGYNLYDGKLLDMQGNIVKQWNYSYLSILDKKGNYYAQREYESLEWGKFDFNDNPIWIKKIPIHHEIYLTDNNTIYTMTKETHEYNGRLVEFDVILEFDENGTELQRWSTWDNLNELQKFHRPLQLDKQANDFIPEDHRKNTSIWGANYDYYHLNSFSLIPPNNMENFHPAFKQGNWILSFRHGSMLFILDKDTKEVLWTAIYDQVKDNLEGQHVPKMLSNGNILVFDNGRYRGWSRILELNTVTLEVVSEYKPEGFFSYSQGFYQILPNNNLLITVSESGHVYEVDPTGKKVWEYYEPNFVENDEFGLIRDEIYRFTRYDKKFIENLMK